MSIIKTPKPIATPPNPPAGPIAKPGPSPHRPK